MNEYSLAKVQLSSTYSLLYSFNDAKIKQTIHSSKLLGKKTILRHDQPLFPYSVAIRPPCRNNSDKNLANFLESAQNPRTFASVKVHTLIVFFLHKFVFGYWLVM